MYDEDDDQFKWEIGNVMLSTSEEGFLSVQVDVFGEEKSGAAPFELHHPFGFLSRPLDPGVDGLGCQVLYAWEGNKGHAWLCGDKRTAAKTPALKKGGSCQYCAKGGFASFDGDDDTWTLYVPVEFDGDGKPTKAHSFTVGLDGNGKRVVNIMHADGMRITMLADGNNPITIANKANNAWLSVNDDGVEINGNLKVKGNMGTGPLMTAWMTTVTAALTTLGAAPGPPPISLTA